MDPLDNLLNSVDYKHREPLPDNFEERVLDKWFNKQPVKKTDYTVFAYAVAACLVAFTCINILSLNLLNRSSASDLSTNSNTTIRISSETEFAEAYGFVETTSYYTLNK